MLSRPTRLTTPLKGRRRRFEMVTFSFRQVTTVSSSLTKVINKLASFQRKVLRKRETFRKRLFRNGRSISSRHMETAALSQEV